MLYIALLETINRKDNVFQYIAKKGANVIIVQDLMICDHDYNMHPVHGFPGQQPQGLAA